MNDQSFNIAMYLAANFADPEETLAERNMRETFAAGLNTGSREPAAAPVRFIPGACQRCVDATVGLRLAGKVAQLGQGVHA